MEHRLLDLIVRGRATMVAPMHRHLRRNRKPQALNRSSRLV